MISKFGVSQPLVLLIDGLDQISYTDMGREVDRWIPPNLPVGVKLIVSMVSDHSARVFPVIRKHIFGQPGFEKLFLQLGRLSLKEAESILDLWLTLDARSLTPRQREEVLGAYQQCSSPLFLRLAYLTSKQWSSYTHDADIKLPTSIQAIIESMFVRLMRTHGTKLVQHACMYITLARDGLTFSELENLLSLDDDVLNDVFQYW